MEIVPSETDTLKIGYHVVYCGTFVNTIRNAMSCNITSAQFFLHSPREWAHKNIDIHDIILAKSLLDKFPSLWVCAHASYIYNLNGVLDCNSPKYNVNYELTINSIALDLDICAALGGGLVVHPGSAKRCDKAFKRMAVAIERSLTEDTSITLSLANAMNITPSELKKRRKIHLENCAGEGSKIGTMDDLRKLLSLVDEVIRPQIGVCIDTCHLFAAKECDLKDVKATDDFFENVNLPITLIHLNDSKEPYGSHKDRHEELCSGEIWEYNTDSLISIIKMCHMKDIPLIIETTDGEGNVKLVNRLYNCGNK